MSKTYIVSRNGGTVTKAPINDNKIPIYANKTAMEADASNIPDGSIVFTKSDHDDVIDQMKEYIRNQNVLSNFEDITISTDTNNPTVMDKDGVLYFSTHRTDDDNIKYIYVNNNAFSYSMGHPGYYPMQEFASIPFKKGDSIYTSLQFDVSKVRYYKLRDYSDRT